MEENKKTLEKPVKSKKWIIGIVGAVLLGVATLFMVLPRPYYIEGFKTLRELQEYAKTIDEFIKMDWDNIANPNYELYYQKNFGPSMWRTTKEKIAGLFYYCGLRSRPLFSPSFFKTILLDVTKDREQQGWIGDFVQKLEVKPNSRVVVFGAIQGSFHPFVRYLEKLKELNIIDENLVIKNPNDYIVFLGNVANRSAYTLEILSIVLRLLKQNPNNVVYLKGTNEFFDYWRQHTLYRELELRAQPLFKQKDVMINDMRSFFNTLPLTLYCTMPFVQDSSNKLNYFKLKPFIRDEHAERTKEQFYASFLKRAMEKKIDFFDISKADLLQKEAESIVMRSVIQDIRKRVSYEKMDGLRLLEPEGSATAWTVLSTSAEPYRLAFDFFYDAFVIVYSALKLEDWKITLYKRDIREKNKNFETRSEYFFHS